MTGLPQYVATFFKDLVGTVPNYNLKLIMTDFERNMKALCFRNCGSGTYRISPGVRFSKVPIINGPGKLLPFILKIEVSIVFHLTL